MSTPVNHLYVLVAHRTLHDAASRRLGKLFGIFNQQARGGGIVEGRAYRHPIDDEQIRKLDEHCRSPLWSVDLFCESEEAAEAISRRQSQGHLRGANIWRLGPPQGDYTVVWAQVSVLHLLRLILAPTSGCDEHPLLWELLDLANKECGRREEKSDDSTPAFNSMENMLSDAEARFADGIRVTEAARRSARDYSGTGYVTKAFRALQTLRECAVCLRTQESGVVGQSVGRLLKDQGWNYVPKDAIDKEDALTTMCCDHRLLCDEHIRLGVRFNRCVRIHFCRCPDCQLFVVQHCGDHL